MTPKSEYDIVIIGGGINGVGIARECAAQGLSVALFEKEDFGSGTSSQSSKLAHGGLRYLEQWDIPLVWEACHERELLLKNAPHLVKPLPFILPIYKTSRRPKWQIRIGLWIYDILSAFKTTKTHKMLSKKELLKQEPHLKEDSLVGGAIYYDAQMDDARIVIETMKQAESLGAHCFNYLPVTKINQKNNKIESIVAGDHTVKAKLFINTTGPWSDKFSIMANPLHQPQLRLSKGIHLITKPLTKNHAILLTAKQDGRVFFVIPWKGYSMIGTTDTDYYDDINRVRSTPADINYLIQATNETFPETPITEKDIITTFAGLRPLIKSDDATASAASREHKIITKSNLISLFGGKYTTYRKMSEDVVKVIFKILKNPGFKSCTTNMKLPNYKTTAAYKKCIAENKEHGEYLYFIRHEKARTITDILRRRTPLKLTPGNGLDQIDSIVKLLKSEINLSDKELTQQKEAYLDLLKRSNNI